MKVLEIKENNNCIKYLIIEFKSLIIKDNKPIEYNNFGKKFDLSNCLSMKIKKMDILDKDNKKIIALIDNKEYLLEEIGLCEYMLKE